ncbi:MAG: hypothetical protein ACFHWX_02820 [Bacteroidota bacterium]
MQKYFYYAAMMTISSCLFGQSQALIGSTQQQFGRQGFFGTLMDTKATNTTIDGSPYINENWKQGKLYLQNEVEVDVELLNYNVFEGSLTYVENNREYLISTYTDLKSFTLGNEDFVYLYTDHSKDIYKLLSDGPIKLLKRYYCRIMLGMDSKGVTVATNDKYMMNDELYVQKEGLQPEEFKTRKKDLFKLMRDKEDKVEAYIDEMNLNVNKESDLITIFDYYNQISSIQ